MNTLQILFAAALVIPAVGLAYEKAFEPTDPGEVEIKKIPERTVIVSRGAEDYFSGDNRMFGQLFRYIQQHDVAMTVPVKADIEPGRMYFYIGTDDLQKDLKSSGSVEVMTEPETVVMSIGIRGGYSEKNFMKARDKLLQQLDEDGKWQRSGEPYAIFWNGPYVPAFMKKFEVHVPVIPTAEQG